MSLYLRVEYILLLVLSASPVSCSVVDTLLVATIVRVNHEYIIRMCRDVSPLESDL